MNKSLVTLVCLVALSAAPASRADAPAPDEVLAIFRARCARCHGPDVRKPRGGFGYILDLRRLAADPDKIVPGRPGESELWLMIHKDEMPPPDSSEGPLSAMEKEVVRAWIAAGAPTAAATPPPPPASVEEPRPAPTAWRVLLWPGRFHLLLLHFPIALLLAAALAEGWSAWKRRREPLPAVRFCLVLGAAAAIPTAALGYLYALGGHGAGSPGLLELHRWLGTAAAGWAVVAAVLSERDAHRGTRTWPVRILILGGALLVGLAAHLGGLLAQGPDFYDF